MGRSHMDPWIHRPMDPWTHGPIDPYHLFTKHILYNEIITAPSSYPKKYFLQKRPKMSKTSYASE